MRFYFCFLLSTLLLYGCEDLLKQQTRGKQKTNIKFENIKVSYPEVFRDTSVEDDYHGKVVADPYRWLEDDDSPETQSWVKAQNQTTFQYLDQIPYRNAIEKRLEKIWNYERFSAPFKEGNKYYFFKNDGLQNQSVLYAQETLDGEAEMVLDPNTFSKDGTASLGLYGFSKEGRYLAYQVSEGGSDWRTVYVRDLQEKTTLEDKVEWVKFSDISWYKDGFFYSRYPAPKEGDKLSGKNEFHQVYYHKIGTSQSEDQLIFADRLNPNRGFSARATDDEKFLVISVWESTSGNAMYFKKLGDETASFVPVSENFDNDFVFVDNSGDNLLLLTNYKAGNNRLISVNADRPEEGYWEEILPESDDKLDGVSIIGNKIIANYIHNASSKVKVFDLQGKFESDIDLPALGTVSGFSGKKEDDLAFYGFTSFTSPPVIYSYDVTTKKAEVFKKPKVDFDSDAFETKQVWFESYDGEKIPMFVTHRKGLKLDGQRPTLLYGYGGFDISILPQFNLTRLNLSTIFLEHDGIFAVVNLRGGGEFGKEWHEAGTKERKQNVFNDFQAAAEYLQANNFTSSEKLSIYGRSNGGLLVGACMTQRPDLYKVALPAVGVLDMLRYDKFTIGRAWATDYGLSEEPGSFDYLFAYSPLHNIQKEKYPATLVTTADHDDRVVPAHSFKFISELQANHKGDTPVLIRIETSAGHGAGKPTSKRIEEAADILSFTFYNLKENINYSQEEEAGRQ